MNEMIVLINENQLALGVSLVSLILVMPRLAWFLLKLGVVAFTGLMAHELSSSFTWYSAMGVALGLALSAALNRHGSGVHSAVTHFRASHRDDRKGFRQSESRQPRLADD